MSAKFWDIKKSYVSQVWYQSTAITVYPILLSSTKIFREAEGPCSLFSHHTQGSAASCPLSSTETEKPGTPGPKYIYIYIRYTYLVFILFDLIPQGSCMPKSMAIRQAGLETLQSQNNKIRDNESREF